MPKTYNIDTQKALQMYRDDICCETIATYFGCSPGTIRVKLKGLGVKFKGRSVGTAGSAGKGKRRGPKEYQDVIYFNSIPKYEMSCLRCNRKFLSWSKTNNRLCQDCHEDNSDMGKVYQLRESHFSHAENQG